MHWKSRKFAHGLAAATVASAVVGALILVSGGASQAAPVSLTLDYSCPFPILADPLTLTVKIDSVFPDNAVAGQKSPAITFDADVTVPADGTDALALIGAATVEGSAKAAAVLKYPVDKTLNLQLPLVIAQTPVPPSGAFHIKTSGKAPSIVLPNPGTAAVTVGNFSTTLTPKTAGGQPTDLGTFTSDCTLKPGQNTQLGTFEIKPAGDPSTTPTTPTSETTPSTPVTTLTGTQTTTPTTEPTTPTTESTTPTTSTTEPTTPTTEPTTPTTSTTEPTTPTTVPTTPTTEPTTPTTDPTTPTTVPTTPTTEPTTPTTPTTVPTTPTTEPTTPTTQPTTPTTEPTTPTTQPTTPTTQPTTPTTPPNGGISVTYTVNGKTQLKGLNATLPLGPGSLKAKLDAQSGKFDAQLSLPKSKLRFRLLGLIPATADVGLDPVGDVSGTLQSGVVKANSKIDVKLSDLRIFGLPVPVSHACHTSKPAQVDLVSGPGFDPLKGGKLTSKYTLPPFSDCGLFTPIISGLASGPGNTLEVNLTRK